ncbi:septum site-determining protein Ssd [Arthrobacter sp. G119Y2]|uniref:septum site-determining protein Ssd n=1 Tax=Arthrobacter sp. G119Y2 TaxID=3134965 RepID=UPI00311A5F2A
MRDEQLWVPAARAPDAGVPGPVVATRRNRGAAGLTERLAGSGGGPGVGVGVAPEGKDAGGESSSGEDPSEPAAATRPGRAAVPPPGPVLPGRGAGTVRKPGRRAGSGGVHRVSSGGRRPGSRPGSRFAAPGANTEAQVVLASRSQHLQDEVARVAAAAGLELEALPDVQTALARNPEVLLLGIDLATDGRAGSWRHARPGANGTETIVVGTGQDPGLWEAAARLDAVRVAVLPAASGWLAEYLSRRRAPAAGYVLGVMGGCGGAGASSLACWLAHEAAEQGISTLLVDGDPYGGGLDASLASGNIPGVRWPDLADVRGSLNPVQLLSALPQVSGFALLSGTAGPGTAGSGADESGVLPAADSEAEAGAEPAEESVRAVMDAARAAFTLTVVDCARNRSAQLLVSCDALLLVVPGRLRPVLAARSLHLSLGPVPQAVVVRGPLGDGLDDARAAEAVGLPLAGYLPDVRNLEHAEARGLLLERGRRTRIRSVTGQLVRQVASGLPAASAASGARA